MNTTETTILIVRASLSLVLVGLLVWLLVAQLQLHSVLSRIDDDREMRAACFATHDALSQECEDYRTEHEDYFEWLVSR